MKDLIQAFCVFIFLFCCVGFLMSSIWGIMKFFSPEGAFFTLPLIKGCIDNFFNWLLAMCLTFLVVDKE